MKVGDIVEYVGDWKGKRPWYLYSISSNGLCTIVLIREGRYTHKKMFRSAGAEWEEEYLNANIVNIDISNIIPYVD